MANPKIRHEHNRPKHAGQEPYRGYHQDSKGELKKDANGKPLPLNPSRTKQDMKDDCDINVILRRFAKTGQLPNNGFRTPTFGEFIEVPDFQEALNIVHHAEEQFSALDAKIRARFENDPAKFLEFATNPANEREMIELGLATERPKPAQPEPTQGGKNSPAGGTPPAGDKPKGAAAADH